VKIHALDLYRRAAASEQEAGEQADLAARRRREANHWIHGPGGSKARCAD
jgi:hypothetical protein